MRILEFEKLKSDVWFAAGFCFEAARESRGSGVRAFCV
jgi:hypothetical protein